MANDVGVVFHDPSKPPSGVQDFIVCRHAWADINKLRRFRQFRIVRLSVFADNPLGNEGQTQYGGSEEYSLSYSPRPEPGEREGLLVGESNSSPSGNDPKRGDFWLESRNASELVGYDRQQAPSGIPRAFLGGDIDLLFFDTSDMEAWEAVEARAANIVWPEEAS